MQNKNANHSFRRSVYRAMTSQIIWVVVHLAQEFRPLRPHQCLFTLITFLSLKGQKAVFQRHVNKHVTGFLCISFFCFPNSNTKLLFVKVICASLGEKWLSGRLSHLMLNLQTRPYIIQHFRYKAIACISDELPLVWYEYAIILLICYILFLNTESKNKLTKQDCYCGDLNCCSLNPMDSWCCCFLIFFPQKAAHLSDRLINISLFRLCVTHFVWSPGFFIIFCSYCYLSNMLLLIPQILT